VVITADMRDEGPGPSEPGLPGLVFVTDGGETLQVLYRLLVANRSEPYESECRPRPPTLPFPSAGEQPSDPVTAEAEIRERHALAVDRSIPLTEEPDLLDDITGVAEAVAEVDAGENADTAASAEYIINDLVFTAPDEAWFDYTISTSAGDFESNHGVARYNGSVWQITRETICQDLAVAGGNCNPAFTPHEPPIPIGWDEVIAEYERTVHLYFEHRNCPPPTFVDEWCVDEPITAEEE
jgi:hypothetical protein